MKDQDYRLNPEHPPLAKALAALPLVLDKKIKGPEANWSWSGINQWESGWYMLYHAGNDPVQILFLARLPMMLLMVLLGALLYIWAARLYGRKVGLIVLTLYAFYPDVLAHGRLVTTDVPAALGFLVAVMTFDKAIRQKTWKTTIFAALGFALAQLMKFSAILLFLIFLILAIVRTILDRKETGGFWPGFWSNFKTYFWVCFLSVIAVWAVYIPFVWKMPASIEHQVIENNLTADPRTLFLRNFLHHFENNPITRALGHYILGIFLVIGRVGGGNVTFILGKLSEKTIRWYFPVAWLLKTSIPVIVLFASTILALALRWTKKKEAKWTIALLLTPILVYWAFTLAGSLNIGIRHLMPTVPFVLLLIGYGIYPIISNYKKSKAMFFVVIALVVYMVASTLSNYPNFISYFNEITPKSIRYERLMDSSLDWGQDMMRLKKYIDDNKISSIKVDYFGGSVPSYFISQSHDWHSGCGPTKGWIAISATFYQSSKLVGPKEGKWSYAWLDKYKPKAIIGGSILVFDITADDYAKNPPSMSYPITKYDYCLQNSDTGQVGF
ncbi:MAG: glycosyltransferase family 39 protein [Candidatus Berkelbacteria bacterium]|nr:glycosyltransferase family 39 protein [Candidatus Berkelbacteria bacterium]